MESYKPTRISGAVTTTIRSGAGKLVYININTPITAGTITVYDNTTATGTILALITSGATGTSPETLTYQINYQIGLTVVTTGASMDVTVSSN